MTHSAHELIATRHQQVNEHLLGNHLYLRQGLFTPQETIELDEPHQAGLKIVAIHNGDLHCQSEFDRQIQINSPTLMIMASQQHYSLRNCFKADQPLRYTLLQLSPEWLEMQQLVLPAPLDNKSNLTIQTIAAPANILAQAIQIFSCPVHDSLRNLYLSSKACELTALCLHQLYQDNHNSQQTNNQNQIRLSQRDIDCLNQAREILISEMEQPPTLDVLASRIGINTRKLTQGFRQHFNNSVYGWLQEYRLQTAYHLLSHQTDSVSSVAYHVGYTPAHFSVAFYKRFGVLPGTLKKR